MSRPTTDAPHRSFARVLRRGLIVLLGVVGALSVTTGARLLVQDPVLSVPDAVADGTPVAAQPAAAGAVSDGVAGPVPSALGPGVPPAPATPVVAAPAHVNVPDVGISAAVLPVGVDPDGALEIPDDPDVLGWWSSGAVPGSPVGSTVLAAHIDSEAGSGPMARMVEVPPGTVVEVSTTDGSRVMYQVVERRSYPKSDGLPRELFAADGPPRLVLITCGGVFDRTLGHYLDNVVVVASPV